MAEVKEKKEKEFVTNAKPKVSLEGAYENPTKKIKLRALDGAKYHKPGSVFHGSEVLARIMEKNGTAERVK
ncbi:MAG TPA: hypothetical protein VD927_06665 [Chryseosolibacter sp.]|nr:hypothetical protein [Chryseosolibacter sp.]